MKHYYRIGEISKLYHIGCDSLRYYEELGILKPHRGKNNYRMYHIHDMWRLNVIRDLRELGFSMERIKDYLDNRSLEKTKELLKEELTVIEQQMESLEKLKSNIQDRLLTLEEARHQPLNIIEEKQLPLRHCYQSETGYQSDEEMDILIKELLYKNSSKAYVIGNNRFGSFISLKDVSKQNYNTYSGVFIIDKDGDDMIPEGFYLSICYKGDFTQNEYYIPKLLDYASQHHLILHGPILELLWADIHQEDNTKDYITELQIRYTK